LFEQTDTHRQTDLYQVRHIMHVLMIIVWQSSNS